MLRAALLLTTDSARLSLSTSHSHIHLDLYDRTALGGVEVHNSGVHLEDLLTKGPIDMPCT